MISVIEDGQVNKRGNLLGMAGISPERLCRPGRNVPFYFYEEDGEELVKPCAEVLMKETMREQLIAAGFIPFVTIKNTDRVEIRTIQSVARTGLFGG